MSLNARETSPILRIFDVDKAWEFYRDYLGFAVAGYVRVKGVEAFHQELCGTAYRYLRPGSNGRRGARCARSCSTRSGTG